MGLCKCPKRKVTSLFCFVHRVNVCEDCIVSQHSKCVVQSYLKWLEDSDYDLNCALCNQSIEEGETVRLICYDLFHLTCLDRYVKSLPQNTASTTYRCPKCKKDILPPSNMVSPVAQVLRQKLMMCSWAKDSSDHLEQFFADLSVAQSDTAPDEDLTDFGTLLTSTPAKTSYSPPPPPSSYDHPAATLHLEHPSLVPGIAANQGYDQPLIRSTAGSQSRSVAVDASALGADSGSSKYQRRSLKQLLPRWCRSRINLTMDETAVMLRRYSILTLLAVFGVVTFILVLTRASQTTAERGPKLGWQAQAN